MKTESTLDPLRQKFVLHWGEMGTRWGINRTVAQIHALLYLAPRPLNADDLVRLLQVARSNVSGSLKELQAWGIVSRVHVMGDKRDHFETMTDVWEMFRVVLDERKKREIDPTLRVLQECLALAEKDPDQALAPRLRALNDFFRQTTDWYEQVRAWPLPALMRLLKLGRQARKRLGLGA